MIEFGYTRSAQEVAPIYEISSLEWSSSMEPQQYVDLEVARFKLYQENGFEPVAFYLKDTDSGVYVALTVIVSLKGWYKQPDSIGANDVTFLLFSYVFTRKEYRKQGLADQLIRQVIQFVELEKLESYKKKYPQKSDLQETLARKYIWYLYSGVGEYYSRFGLKSHNIDFFKIPFNVISDESKSEIDELISGDYPNKSIRLLKSSSPDDQSLIKHILQNKELQMITQITFNSQPTDLNSVDYHIPKCAIKHDYNFWKIMNTMEKGYFDTFKNQEISLAADISGAIFTNRAQNKSYYCLWATVMFSATFIVAMGEIQIDQTQIRKTSFTSLSELEGYNLSDVEILLKTATYVALKRYTTDGAICVTAADLPCEIPPELLKDYLMSFDQLEIVASDKLRVLPMIRKFGSDSPDFELDWTSVGMYSWN